MSAKTVKIRCILCNGAVAFDKGDTTRFSDHLRTDHEASDGLDWVLAGSVVSPSTRQKVLHVIERSNPLLRGKTQEKDEKVITDIELSDDEDTTVTAMEKEQGSDKEPSSDAKREEVTKEVEDGTTVYDNVYKMLIEERGENTARKKRLADDKLLEENAEAEVEKVNKPQESVIEDPLKQSEVFTGAVEEEKRETQVRRKRRRTELKSDVKKSIVETLEAGNPQSVSGDELHTQMNNFSAFHNAENTKVIECSPDYPDVSKNGESEIRKKGKRKKSVEENEKGEEEPENLSLILLRREAEVDLSCSDYFLNRRTMITALTDERLKDPTFVRKVHRDSNLPDNWFTLISFFSNGTRRVRDFITPDRRIIRSMDGVAEFMKASDQYSQKEIEDVMSNISSKSRRSMVKREVMT